MSKDKEPQNFTVILSEQNFAAFKVISSIANGSIELTVIRGQVSVIKPQSQRIDLQRADELAAIVNGLASGATVDMSEYLGTKPEVLEAKASERGEMLARIRELEKEIAQIREGSAEPVAD